ncbi:MAG: VanZ family protein [Candidatus Sulfotelmatobacter sp.]
MTDRVLGVSCCLVLCCIVIAGLWPFHAPKNQVEWSRNREGLKFGNYGSIVSSSDFESSRPSNGPCSLEIWLQPRQINRWGTILAFYSSKRTEGLTVRQSWGDVVLLLQRPDARSPGKTVRIYVGDVFRREKSVLVTISAGDRGTAIYSDGVLAKISRDFHLTTGDFTGRLVIGNSPVKPDSWSGELKGIAIYDRELTATEAGQHYQDWTRTVPSDSIKTVGAGALYLFDEGRGHVVHSQVKPAHDLVVPDRFFVLHQQLLQTPWEEYRPGWRYWENVGVNVLGFAPLGFVLYAYFYSTRKAKRAATITIALGLGVSLTIEILQAFLPTRDSGMTDLITNTLGTAVGVILYAWIGEHCWFARSDTKIPLLSRKMKTCSSVR